MNATRIISSFLQKGWVVVALLSLLAVSAFGQNITNTGSNTITNTGIIKLTGTFTPATQTSIGGLVEYNKAGAQNIAGLTYTNLKASGGVGDKTLVATTTVSGTFTVDNGVKDVVLSGQTLHVTGANPFTESNGTFNFTSGTVDYNGSVGQALLGTTYQYLSASGGGSATKTAGGAVTVSAGGGVTNAASTVIDFGANAFTATGATLSTNSGTLKSTGTVSVDATATIGGTFEYYNSASSQTVAPAYYTNLTLSGGTGGTGQKNFSGLTKISNVYTAGGANRNYAAGTATIEFNGGTQTITGESNYYAVILSAAGTKTLATPMALTNTFTHSAGTLEINTGGSLALGTTAGFQALNINGTGALTGGSGQATFSGAVDVVAGGGSITAGAGLLLFSSTLANAGTITVGAGKAMTLSNTFTNNSGTYSFAATSTVTYNKAGAQDVVAANYGNLALAGGNTKSLYGTVGIQTSLATSGTTHVTVASGTTTLAASATASFDGDLTTTGTFDASASGTLTTFGGGSQTIGGTDISFNNLTLVGSAAKISNVNLTVGGTFTGTKGIAMQLSPVKTLTVNGTVGTYGSLAEVTGKMTVAVPAAGPYTLTNSATTILFSGAEASRTFTVTNQPGTSPTGSYDGTVQVNRKVTVDYTNWATSTATLQLGYLVGEKPSANENKLRYWRNDNTVSTNKVGTGFAISRTASGADFGYLSLAGIKPTAASGSSYSKINAGNVVVMANNAAAFITVASADWNTNSTWDEGSVPGPSDDAVVNTTGVTIADLASGSVRALTINASSDLTLTAGTSGTLTISSGLTNYGSLTVGSGRTVAVTGNLTNSGSLSNAGTITVE